MRRSRTLCSRVGGGTSSGARNIGLFLVEFGQEQNVLASRMFNVRTTFFDTSLCHFVVVAYPDSEKVAFVYPCRLNQSFG